ncbi:2'-5' RNA ligase family protein [Nocardia sp. NBC_00508]|uniref:2'-5' RNA ligase family protein n=1 Tax=Nocardia sp. NBC_00508 TaxID=2975992 RepID=UPI002E7FBF57|nr:2'-5' RNA ligase family protein [Nocardia sp. NBC_00508]WUD64916.1 2'-5' RNA ligase family protein [Nocardia sp. NBC_00508]
MVATKRPFPLFQPASTSDPVAIRDNDWTAFRQLGSLHDHWSLKSWAPGQSGFYWYLTFDDPALADLAEQCQKSLADDGIDPVPLDGLHLTLLSVGRTGDISDEQLAGVADAAHARLSAVAPFDLDVGPLTGSRSALRFSVTPWDTLLDLHRLLREATATQRSASRLTDTTELRPHLGIGYINRPQNAATIVADIAALRDLPPVTVHVNKVHLVELRRDGRQYRWTDRAVLSLG